MYLKHLFNNVIVFLLIIAFTISLSAAGIGFDDDFGMDDDMEFHDQGKANLGLAVSGWFGISDPDKGYKGYRTNPVGGGDIRLLLRNKKGIKYYCSLAMEYMPLAPPKGVDGYSEKIFNTQINIVSNYLKHKRFIPYFGFGLGYYWVTFSQDIPNFGSRSGKETYFGFNGLLGLEYRINPYVSICPQYNFHYISQAGIYATVPIYSIHAVIYIGRRLGL